MEHEEQLKPAKNTGRQRLPKNKYYSKELTYKIRESLGRAMADHIERIPEYLSLIEDTTERLNIIAKFMPYLVPRMQTQSISLGADKNTNLDSIKIQVVRNGVESERNGSIRPELPQPQED